MLLICPFISSFFFLSNFQTLEFFITLFSGTVRPRRLKLGTQVDRGQMYRVYRNQAAASYLSLYFSFFFLSSFQTLKFFVTLFSGTVRPRRLKLGKHMDSGGMYRVYWNNAAALIHPFIFPLVHTWTVARCIVYTRIRLLLLIRPLISSIFLSLQFSNIKISRHFSEELWGLEG